MVIQEFTCRYLHHPSMNTHKSSFFTCSRTGPLGASCFLFGSHAASCIYRVPGARSPDGSYRWPFLSCRHASEPSLASMPKRYFPKINKRLPSLLCNFLFTLSWSCNRSLRSAIVRLSSTGSLIFSSVSKSRETSPPPDPLSPLVMSSSSPFSFSTSAKWWWLGVWVASNKAAAASCCWGKQKILKICSHLQLASSEIQSTTLHTFVWRALFDGSP